MAAVKMKVDGLDGPGTRNITIDLPSNSKTSKEEPIKKVEKVITGKVVEQKKGLGKKFSDIFLDGDSVNSVFTNMFIEVLIPAAKGTLYDMITGGFDALKDGFEMTIFGTTSGRRTRRNSVSGKSYVSYDKAYNNRSDNSSRKPISNQNKARHNFDDIILETKGEAEEVLSHLVDLTIDYGLASVADLYDLVGITSNFTDNKWGWDDLSSAKTIRVRNGYLLDLPKVIEL